MKEIKLQKFTYSPGYSDMRGARHQEILHKNENGEWTITSEDCDCFSDPVRVTGYAVSAEKLEEFERFLKEKKILSLSKRLKSSMFATDYSPWEYRITLEDEASSKKDRDEYCICEYRIYSKHDIDLLKELNRRFKELHGEIVSEEIKKDEE
ncbi:MAG: hypothetical protein IKS51_08910 [Erysipelotrichaceae bacterium]|nr:hypothetical protein [Erysipelotrichaceae bacterium]